ncbi:gluconokinase, partial [Cutibacterium acnes]
YRDRLRQAPGRTVFAHLAGTTGLIEERMTARTDHFMPTTLLPSQFATLEPLQDDEDGIVVDVLGTPEDVAREIVRRLQLEPVSA